MDEIIKKIEKLCEVMGFDNVKISNDDARRKISVFVDDEIFEREVVSILPALDHIVSLMIKKANLPPCVVDVNYYRKERERLIVELARAAAHKAMVTKQSIDLPPMNSYERRLVHMEISIHPELTTESIGETKERHIVIKKVDEKEDKKTEGNTVGVRALEV